MRTGTWPRCAGVEFLRGLPSEVQHDEQGRPVVEVEDMTSKEKRGLRPDLVVLSSGFVPAQDGERLARVLGVNLDDDGFVEILDRKNRATETSAHGIFVCGSASGPKALVECNTEASAVASEVHNFLASSGRLTVRASEVLPDRCIGCGQCRPACPYGAITLVDRPAETVQPKGLRQDAPLAGIDPDACRACGICAAVCPEMAVRHNLSDEAIYGRVRLLTEGVEWPVLGFYCKECAGVAISLSGARHDSYPVDVRLVELPCLGRVSSLHIIEAARLGVRGVFLAGCAEGRCQFRKGDVNAAEQARQARDFLASTGVNIPIEVWHLCAVDRHSVARQIRLFYGKTRGDDDDRNPLRLDTSAGAANCGRMPGVLPVRPVYVGLSDARDLDRGPRLVIRLLLSGDIAKTLACEDIWRCNECGACSRACPMEIDIVGVLSRLRNLEFDHGDQRCPEREATRIAVERLAHRRHINNIAFGTAMALRGHLPRDIRGAMARSCRPSSIAPRPERRRGRRTRPGKPARRRFSPAVRCDRIRRATP